MGLKSQANGFDSTNGDHGGDERESFEGHEGIDEGFALPVAQELEHRFFELGDALVMKIDGGEIVLEDAIVGGITVTFEDGDDNTRRGWTNTF